MAPDNIEERNEGGVEGEVNTNGAPTPGNEVELTPVDGGNDTPDPEADIVDQPADEPADPETVLEDEEVPTTDTLVDEPAPETEPSEPKPTVLVYRGVTVIGEPRETVINGNLCVVFKALDQAGGEQEYTVMKEEFQSEALVKEL